VPKVPQLHHDLSCGLYLYGWPSQQPVLHFAPGSGPTPATPEPVPEPLPAAIRDPA